MGLPYPKRFLAGAMLVVSTLFQASPVTAAETASVVTDASISSSLIAPAHQKSSGLQKFFSNISQYLGIRYRFGGNSTSGFDCSGFVRFMFSKELDVDLPHSSSEMATLGKKVDREELRPGDLVFFRNAKNRINHVGIFIGNNTFVHASLSKGITRDTLSEDYYDKRYATAVRIVDEQENDLSRDIEHLLDTLPEEESAS